MLTIFSGRATSVAYVGPSVSPYYDLNLGYRIYYVDGDHEATTRVRDSCSSIFLFIAKKFNAEFIFYNFSFSVSSGPRDVDNEFKGGQSFRVPNLV